MSLEPATREGDLGDAWGDDEIDALLPDALRARSRVFWTPVHVARRVAQILNGLGCRRVLDVGCGPGKLAVVAAQLCPILSIHGVDHRPHLVTAARVLASRLGVANVSFELGDATQVAWTGFEAFYAFNPFAENDFSATERLDDTVPLSRAHRVHDLLRAAQQLDTVDRGAVLVTYHGLGGPIPSTWECLHTEAIGSGWVRVWYKARVGPIELYWMEHDDRLEWLTPRDLGHALGRQLDPRTANR